MATVTATPTTQAGRALLEAAFLFEEPEYPDDPGAAIAAIEAEAVTDWLASEEAERRLDAALMKVWKHSQAMVFGSAEEAWFSDEMLAAALLKELRESQP